MAQHTYDEAIKRLLTHEGGYSNHESDPGGPTNFGITIIDYRKYIKANGTADDVRRMSVADAKKIYWERYALPLRYPEEFAGVDYAVFDYGVNSGIGRAGKVLKRVLGMDASTSTITPDVIVALSKRDPAAVVAAICDERLRFLQALKTWPVFGKGWGRRVKEVLSAATAMAMGTLAPAPATSGVGTGLAQVPEPKKTKELIRTGGGTGAAAAGATWSDWVFANPRASILIFAAAVGLIWLALRELKKWHRRRQEEPMPNTPVVPELPVAA